MSNVKTATAAGQPNLSKQDLSKLDITKLTALSPEVISRQATINIGTIGHVAHGKSTVVKAVSGVQTVRFKNELERNITIKLGISKVAEFPALLPIADMKHAEPAPEKTRSVIKSSVTNGKKVSVKKHLKRKRSSSQTEYEVEHVLDHREHYGRVISYKVKWKGWSYEDCTWEPLDNLRGCLESVVLYFENMIYPGVENIPHASKVKSLRENLSRYEAGELEDLSRQYFTAKGHCIPVDNLEEVEYLLTILARLPSSARDPKLMREVRFMLLCKKLISKRNKQLSLLKEWEEEINQISTDIAPITVCNAVDLEGPPVNFSYINHSIPGFEVTIPNDPFVGCECSPCTRTSKCCNSHTGGPVYNNSGLLKVCKGTPIYECNKRCLCGPDCTNRVAQKGRTVPLCIFKTTNGCGWGVKTLAEIKKGQFVTEYVGEVIPTGDAERRGRLYDKQGRTYLFDLDFNDKQNFPYTVDAAVFGNASHFINHSCNPNLEVFAFWVDCLDPNIPRLGLFACRHIKSGEELSFDYLCQPFNEDRESKSNFKKSNDVNGTPASLTLCKCGAHNCRKYLF